MRTGDAGYTTKPHGFLPRRASPLHVAVSVPLSRLARPPSAGGYTARPFRAEHHRATPRFATAPVGKPYCKVFMSRGPRILLNFSLQAGPRRTLLRSRVGERIEYIGVRVPSAVSLHGAAPPLLAYHCVRIFAPHLFCVDENPRLTACTRAGNPRRAHRLPSIVQSGIHVRREDTYRHARRVLSYRRVLNP
ncbi:hypothetical protein B0H19DRAFT_1079707 [Mycena capillaripes]|nr:hypothetical protein B0H19DRAFT_1079707 [Mycena capillaripes]